MLDLNDLLKQLNHINLGYFKNIQKCYVLGDIHGDVFKFIDFLISINIIKSSSLPLNYNCYDVSFKQMNKDINNYIKFNDVNIKNTCIVQLGDITDGHNTCSKFDSEFINNDILIYAIINKVISLLNNCFNSYFILIAGNHDIENVFNIYCDKKITNADCNSNKYSKWANYILNANEITSNNKKKILINKLTKRRNYLINEFDIMNNMYFIVSINDTIFSHTVLYKTLLKQLGLYLTKDNLINELNKIFKICLFELHNKKSIEKNTFDNIINSLLKMASSRSLNNNKLKNEHDIIDNKYNYFVGHEIQDSIKKIKHSMFNFYIYYVDIGMSKSLYDKNTITNYYYITINYSKNKTISINKCTNEKCMKY